MEGKIGILQGDITTLAVDAIVNAANTTLLGGSGVDGAIHQAAGQELLTACQQLNGCNVGQAKITPGFQLPARSVIHTVGPIWQGGKAGEAELLASCYRESLQLAITNNVQTIAFPAISCGAYGCPVELAATIAVQTVVAFLVDPEHQSISGVTFVCFSDSDYDVFVEAFGAI
jgi:O-acetyl-ADP-ribose deacetylase